MFGYRSKGKRERERDGGRYRRDSRAQVLDPRSTRNDVQSADRARETRYFNEEAARGT